MSLGGREGGREHELMDLDLGLVVVLWDDVGYFEGESSLWLQLGRC